MIDYWGFQALFISFLAVFTFSAFLSKKIHLLVGASFFIVCASGLRIFYSPISPFEKEPQNWKVALDSFSSEALAIFLIISVLCITFLELKFFKKISNILKTLAVINAVIMIGGYFFHKPYGILLNSSMSGCMSATLLPLFEISIESWFFSFLLFLSVLVSGQSLPLAVLSIIIGCALFEMRLFKTIIIAIIFSIGIGYMIAGPDLFVFSGRLEVWSLSMHWWMDHVNTLIGLGLGTYAPVGAMLTKHMSGGKQVFIWMHSDWLQLLFEHGIIGFICIFTMYLFALKRAFKTKEIFYSMIGYGAWAIANMPLHYPIAAIVGAMLIILSFDADGYYESFFLPS